MKQAEIQKKQLNELVLWDKNPRAIKEVDYERLKNLIKELGLFKPFVINQDNIILGGNMRYRVCKDLGYKEVFVSVVKTNNEAEMFAYALADNDRAGYYEEDKVAELVLQNPTLKLDMYKLDLGQLTPVEDLLERFGPSLEEDEPPELEEGEAISKLGEVYQLGRHRVMCGDSTKIEDVEKLMNGQKADMVFTDPPYGMDFQGSVNGDGSPSANRKLKQITNETGSDLDKREFIDSWLPIVTSLTDNAWYICYSRHNLRNMLNAVEEFKIPLRNIIIWNKNRQNIANTDYKSKYELILYGWSKHLFYGELGDSDVWEIDKLNKAELHPTMKPVALVEKAIKNSSVKDNLVADLFGGSGTTLIACEQLNRTCYMMELDPKYVDVIRKRYHKFVTGSEEGWEINTPKLNV